MNKAEFIAAQRIDHACASGSLMGEPWECRCRRFMSSAACRPSLAKQRRAGFDGKGKAGFAASGGTLRLSRSKRPAMPRRPWRSPRRPCRHPWPGQGLQGRVRKPRRGLARAEAQAEELSGLPKRDFAAGAG